MFGEISSWAIVFLVGSVTAILLSLIYIALRNPVLAKLGLRSLARRPGQTALIIVGLTLSTIIVISSLGTGDTLRDSVQRQAVAAYGRVDEVIAPPVISMLMNLNNSNADETQARQAQSTLQNLMKGGLDSVLALAQGGLPSISMDRLERLRAEAAQTEPGKEPLIDGVAGAVVFPTIIRNTTTGQSEPLGFVYAVDDQYPQTFGLRSVTGQPLTMDKLEPGIGNIFLQASRLLAVVPTLAQNLSSLGAQLPGAQLPGGGAPAAPGQGGVQAGGPVTATAPAGAAAPAEAGVPGAAPVPGGADVPGGAGVSGGAAFPNGQGAGNLAAPSAAAVLAGVGAILTGVDPQALPNITMTFDLLNSLGVNTQPLRDLGMTSISLRELAQLVRAVNPPAGQPGAGPGSTGTGGAPNALPSITATADLTDTALISAANTVLATSPLTGTLTTTGALSALSGVSSDLLRAVNLNTIGYELDRNLAPFGLQLRQGDLYLNRLGAQRLGASVGDVLELYIGPLPVRFRVRAVVDEAGPLSALLPVVMMRLSEAQQLFFMDGKINAVLVSNRGDEITGMQHTDEVSKRLAVLALDDNAVNSINEMLHHADVRSFIEQAAQELPPTPQITIENRRNVPPMLAGVIETIANSFNIQRMSQQDVRALLDAADKGDTAALRESLAKQNVREWLLNVDLPLNVTPAFANAVSNLNQFEQIEPLNKTTIVTAANVGGSVFASIFSIFGVFSILAAILLIVLIFVMLAAERRVEIGVARAVGVQRSQLAQMFMTEGMVYNLLAGALGVILGIAITYAMTAFISQLFNDATGQINQQVGGIFAVRFSISWQSVVVAYCLGVLITWLAMTLATWRISRMNIVTAIRDLPDEAEAKRRSPLGKVWSWVFPLAISALGGYLLYLALDYHSLSLAMIGLTVALYGVTTLIGRVLELTPLRNETGYAIVYTLLGLGLLAIWIPPWHALAPNLFPGLFTWDPTQAPTVFAIGGPMIIVGVILVIMFNAGFLSSLIAGVLGFIPSLRPVLKTAIAYPLSTRFRTGMTMVLFAMIMATVVVMAVIIHTTQSLIRLDPKETAGFDIRVSPTLLSFFSPVTDFPAQLASLDPALAARVETVGLLTNQAVQARVAGSGQPYRRSDVTGVNQGYIQQAQQIYRLQGRAPGFADDAAVWQALGSRDDVVVVKPSVLGPTQRRFLFFGPRPTPTPSASEQAGTVPADPSHPVQPVASQAAPSGGPGGPPRRFQVFHVPEVEVRNGQIPELYVELSAEGQDGVTRTRKVQVIGVLAEDATLAPSAMLSSEGTLRKLRSVPVTGDEIYVKVKNDSNPAEAQQVAAQQVAAGIERAFVASGLDATVLADEYAQRQRLTGGALQLLQGFMALGLLVGIAALGVISIRAVIERRQQVGMLRALGFQKGMVGLAFMLESSFVSITGLLIGALTGIVLGENIIAAFFPQIDRSIVTIPWVQIGLMVAAAYLFSLLTTILPAWQASRIYPAEALRYE